MDTELTKGRDVPEGRAGEGHRPGLDGSEGDLQFIKSIIGVIGESAQF